MSDVLVDAALLACPDPDHIEPDERYVAIDAYLSKLASISDLRSKCAFVRFWRDETLLDVLYESNAYPFRHSLAKAFGSLAADEEFQLEDANVLATALLERSLVFEHEGEIADIVVSSGVLIPDFDDGRPDPFKEQLFRSFALALSILGDGSALGENVLIATTLGAPATRTACFTVEMQVDGEGNIVEPRQAKELQFKAYCDPDATVLAVNIQQLWNEHQAYEDCMALQAAREHASPAESFTRFRSGFDTGSDFIESARALGFLHDPKKISRLLRVIADLLNFRNLADSHWLRTGMGGNDPQRMRGKWAAWRHDIDDEFHLHYWREGSRIELANVVTHNDFSITK